MISFTGKTTWKAVLASGLIVGVAAIAYLRNSPAPVAEAGKGAVSPGAVRRSQAAEVWTCPMHPQIKKTGPGTCPICGMSLVKAGVDQEEVSAEDSAGQQLPEGHAPFKLSIERRQMIGVRYGRVEKRPLFKSIEAAGRVAFDPELYTAQNEYVEALKQVQRVKDSPIPEVRHSARRMLESAKLRLKILGLSDRQIALIASAMSKGDLSGEAGAEAAAETGGNLLIPRPGERLWIYAEVFEQDLASVQPGLEASLSGGSLGGREILGKVVSVDRVINPTTRTTKVRISVPDGKALLRPESYVDVTIRSPLGEQVAVPVDAVFDTGKQAWVFVVKEDGTFEPRLVTIKYRTDDEVAIGQGVRAGEKIVTSANFLIDSESKLKGVLAGQVETGAEPSRAPKAPECPKGHVWHAEMKHCMPKAGN